MKPYLSARPRARGTVSAWQGRGHRRSSRPSGPGSRSPCTSTTTNPRAPSYGLEAAEKLGLDPARVFKTLVADVDGTLTVAVVPVEAQLDLRALGKRAALADVKAAERTTGYVAGGISPLGQRKRLPTVLDESALLHSRRSTSARGGAASSSSSPRPTSSRSRARASPRSRRALSGRSTPRAAQRGRLASEDGHALPDHRLVQLRGARCARGGRGSRTRRSTSTPGGGTRRPSSPRRTRSSAWRTLRDGDTAVYETGAMLLYLVERFPEAALGPLPGEPGRGELLRWVTWLANTLHPDLVAAPDARTS